MVTGQSIERHIGTVGSHKIRKHRSQCDWKPRSAVMACPRSSQLTGFGESTYCCNDDGLATRCLIVDMAELTQNYKLLDRQLWLFSSFGHLGRRFPTISSIAVIVALWMSRKQLAPDVKIASLHFIDTYTTNDPDKTASTRLCTL